MNPIDRKMLERIFQKRHGPMKIHTEDGNYNYRFQVDQQDRFNMWIDGIEYALNKPTRKKKSK